MNQNVLPAWPVPTLVLRAVASITTALLLISPGTRGAEAAKNPEELFQRALFAEEGRRDLTNAIRDYEEVVRRLDEQRRLAATALFRLGECYRKLGRANDAAAQFERVLREYSSEDALATLAEQNLSVVTGSAPRSATAATEALPARGTPGADATARTQLEQESALLLSQLEQITALRSPERQAIAAESFWPNTELAQLRRQLANQEVRLSELRSSFADEHPDVKAQAAGLATLKNRFRQEVADLIGAQETKLATLQAAIQKLRPAGTITEATNATRTPANTLAAITSKEAEEIRRIQSLVTDSPDLINALSPNGESLLQTAAAAGQLAVARFLLDHGAKVNLIGKDTFRLRPLHAAVQAGHKAMVELLLQRGAEVQATDGRGFTPLHYAASMGFRAIAEVLIEAKADVNALWNGLGEESGRSPLALAAQGGRLEVAELLIERGADPNLGREEHRPPLAFAHGVDLVRLLLERGADPNADAGLRLTVAVTERETEVVRQLLEKGANPDIEPVRMKQGVLSPLLAAVRNADRSIANLLCSKGANLNRFGADGLAPIHLIAGSSAYDLDWLAWALRQKADPNLRDQARGLTPLESTKPAEVRAQSVAKDSVESRKLRQLLWSKVELLLRQGADPGLKFSDGFTVAHHLAMSGGPDELALLVELKADLNVSGGPMGATPLMVAVCNENLPAVEYLLRSGANPNLTDLEKNTSLHLAAAGLSLPTAKALVEAKADRTLRDDFGLTAAELASAMKGNVIKYRVEPGSLGLFRLVRGSGGPNLRNDAIRATDFATLVQILTP